MFRFLAGMGVIGAECFLDSLKGIVRKIVAIFDCQVIPIMVGNDLVQ